MPQSHTSTSREVIIDLYQCIWSDAYLDELMEKAYDYFQSPIFCVDSYDRVIAERHGDGIDSATWRQIIEHGGFEHMDVGPTYAESMNTQMSSRQVQRVELDGSMTACMRMVTANDVVLGLFAVLEQNRLLTADDKLVMQTVADIIAIKSVEMPSSLTSVYQPIITDLIQGRVTSAVELQRVLRAKRWEPASFHRVLVIAMEDAPQYRVRNSYITKNLQALPQGRKIIRLGDELLVIVEYDAKLVDLHEWPLIELINRYKLQAGVSNEFTELIDLRKHYLQAQKAIRYSSDTNINVSLYSTFMFEDFMDEIRDHLECRDYCHPGVMLLHQYDMQHHTDLCQTLYEYLSSSKSLADVAERMGIHKNTVINRINRVRSIASIDLDDDDDAFYAVLSLRLLDGH